MQATDLLNPGDFHQVTQQIRELVAYAISQLENAKDDGSLPSGKFAAFLHDAAVKCPGFIPDDGAVLGPNQVVIEDGDTVTVESYEANSPVVLSVENGVLVAAKFPKDDRRIIPQGQTLTMVIGGSTTRGAFNIVHPSYHAVYAQTTTITYIANGQRLPVHDLGGETGFMYATVGDNKLQDIRMGTDRVHLLRAENRYQITGVPGITEVRAKIDAAHTVTFVKEK